MEDKKNSIKVKRVELLAYTNGMVLPSKDLMDLDAVTKLIMCQITPPKVIKEWPLWPYVPVWYIERCLNFVSNFDRGVKVHREWMCEYDHTKSDWKIVKVYDAWVIADFYIVLDWKRIERSCYWSWKQYKNPQTSVYNVYESARSIATKSFADTLWIASDKLSKEFDAIREKKEEINIEEATAWFTSQ